MICFTLSADTLQGMTSQVDRYRDCFDILEVRLDFLRQDERDKLLRSTALPAWLRETPLILTLRRQSDGGAWNGDDTSRLNYLSSLVVSSLVENHSAHPVGAGRSLFLDLEDDVVALDAGRKAANVAALHGVQIIRSRHDFQGTPEDPAAVLGELATCGGPGEIPKLAVQVRGTGDLVRLVRAAATVRRSAFSGASGAAHGGAGDNDMRFILVGMGSFGFPSRVLAPRIGSFLSYGSDPGEGRGHAAPGQIDPRSMDEVYRLRSQGPNSEVFGIIGNPVLHSRSPAFHNAAFSRHGRDAVYVPFPTDDLTAFRELMSLLDIRGLSVTIPHKEKVVSWFEDRGAAGVVSSPELAAVGACNTVTRSSSGDIVGANTDVAGFLLPLLYRVPSLRDRGVTVLGAGGASRAVVYGLLSSGARVLVLNRNQDRANSLAAEYGDLGRITAGGLGPNSHASLEAHNDIIVQTTSVGMHPDVDADPLSFYEFSGTEVFYEIIYAPPKTKLLVRAEAAGCVVIGGEEMFLAQAELQAGLFAQTESI
ncbi:MAG: type I 3-dehydroquinate dehydratase [Spirochaetia bacterium]